jgi:DNA modification methylase
MLAYEDFLASKSVILQSSGIEVPLASIHDRLFPFQKALVQWALRKGRAALFANTGLGKTNCQLEFARLTEQRALIIAPLSVARQTVSEAAKIGITAHYTRSGSDLIDGINITNYEMISHFNPEDFGTVVLDESSILKSLTGAIRTKLIEMFESTPYRLCCTATPAPNDHTEIGQHAEFLGIMTRGEMLSMFFVHDSKSGSGDGWRLKGHAQDAFYKWLASWSMSVQLPSNIGNYSDEGYILPALNVHKIVTASDYVPEGQLFFAGLKGIVERSQARKSTIEERVAAAIEIVKSSDEQWVIWCGMNDESSPLARGIVDSMEICGSDKPDKKIWAIERFQDGKIRVLITKAKIAGSGINLQNCHNMIFVGLNDSFELYYQAVRRCYRFGQEHPVNVYIVLSEIEEEIYQNVIEKEKEATKMNDQLIKHVTQFERDEIENVESKPDYQEKTVKDENYTLMLGDSCERLAEVADASVDLSVFSPPFAQLYTYSATERDLGNCKSEGQFYEHFHYIINHLLRVTKPGRNVCVHVQQLAASLVHDGFIGMKDFRGEVVGAFVDRGFVYHGEVVIDKDPQVQAVRTKAKGLMFIQLHKDSSWSRPGMADYILLFRKPGTNAVPILPDISNEEWIQWARPIWYDIRETETLNTKVAKEEKDERHVCPLQLGTIERCIRLWSNPGETVLSPFMGIGSEGHVAMQQNRKFIGIELKPSYYKTACKNIENALSARTQTTLWDFCEEEIAI